MPLTNAQIIAFFEGADQMAIPNRTRLQLHEEGIENVNDLVDFDEDSMKQISENLRRPPGRVPDPDPGAGPGDTIPTPPFVFGAKSQIRLKAAAELMRYYDTVGRALTATNIQWNPVIKNFAQHWKALTNRKGEDTPEVPKITRSLPIVKWTESFHDFLYRTLGARTIPLAYVVRSHVNVDPVAAPPNAADQPYAAEHGSVEEELIARASHTHPLYREDNAQVYFYLEEATRTTSYAASIKPHQRRRDGRGAWLAMVQQYAGEDKWRAELKRQDDLLHTRKWKGQNNFSLEKFIAQHRNAFVSMSQCAEHVDFQLPNALTRVSYLLDAIECNDAPLQAAMALVRNDTGAHGKMNDFEDTASFLLPHDPVARKRAAAPKRQMADISAATSTTSDHKSGLGQTGVELRFHTKDEYDALTPEQRQELRAHRDKMEKEGKGRELSAKTPNRATKSKKSGQGGNGPSKRLKAMVAEAVAKGLETQPATPTKKDDDIEKKIREVLISLVNADSADGSQVKISAATSTNEPPQPPAVTLTSILKRVKGQG